MSLQEAEEARRGAVAQWLWVAMLRLGLAVAMAVYVLTFRALPSHPAPTFFRPLGLALAFVPATLSVVQLFRPIRRSRRLSIVLLAVDALVVLGFLGLFAFDVRRGVIALILVVQAESALLLGLFGALWVWAATTAASIGIEAASVATTGVPMSVRETVLRSATGLLLALGGGALAEELTGERVRRLADREHELREVRETEARFRRLVELTPAVTYVEAGDRNRSTLYMSPQATALLGYGPQEWTSDPQLWLSRLHPDDRARVLGESARANTTGEPFIVEYRLIAHDGRVVWVRDEAVSVPDPATGARLWQGVMVDITERRRVEERVAYLAYHDNLTGLPNRAMFEQTLDLALSRARRHGLAVAVLYMDLDDFKQVNDSLGHSAGDDFLREVAARLQGSVREADLVARQGGDEFLVLLGDMDRSADVEGEEPNAAETARVVAARVHEALAPPIVLSGTEFRVSVSIGVSLYPYSAANGNALLRQADAAMYRSKRTAPGETVLSFSEEEGSPERPSLVSRLRLAVETGSWVLHYQPIVDLAAGEMIGVEALIRWRDEHGRLVLPGEFIPLAEETGLMGPIGDWVMAELCRQASEWRADGLGPWSMSFNLSQDQLAQDQLADRLLVRIEEAGLEPANLMVEVTESSALSDRRSLQALHDLRAGGLRIAIDDFGTDYSSLARLKDLPVDVLKIDRPFLIDVPGDPAAARMLSAVIALVRALGMEPIAEGVETEEQRRFLVEAGCTVGQGFRFSEAVAAPELRRFAATSGLTRSTG